MIIGSESVLDTVDDEDNSYESVHMKRLTRDQNTSKDYRPFNVFTSEGVIEPQCEITIAIGENNEEEEKNVDYQPTTLWGEGTYQTEYHCHHNHPKNLNT